MCTGSSGMWQIIGTGDRESRVDGDNAPRCRPEGTPRASAAQHEREVPADSRAGRPMGMSPGDIGVSSRE